MQDTNTEDQRVWTMSECYEACNDLRLSEVGGRDPTLRNAKLLPLFSFAVLFYFPSFPSLPFASFPFPFFPFLSLPFPSFSFFPFLPLLLSFFHGRESPTHPVPVQHYLLALVHEVAVFCSGSPKTLSIPLRIRWTVRGSARVTARRSPWPTGRQELPSPRTVLS